MKQKKPTDLLRRFLLIFLVHYKIQQIRPPEGSYDDDVHDVFE